ncbi:MAG TPA: FAD-dependent oxidoreductase [Vampirovibrionales bacterium]
MNKNKKVVIVGGGLAGLSAAKQLVNQGFSVQVLEGRNILGGKASSWKDADGDWVESGLHVFFGSYRKIFDLMKDVGCYENISWQTPSIQYKMPGGDGFQIVSNEHLPPPLNLIPNFVFGHKFSFLDLLKYCRAIIPILLKDQKYIDSQDSKTFQDWVNEFGISEDMVNKMFLPKTLSLKFLPPSKISAQVVLNVFKLFIANPKGFKIGFLNGSPQEKLHQPISDYLTKKGVDILTGKRVSQIVKAEDSLTIKSVITSEGESFDADAFIFALPTHKHKELLSPHFEGDEYFENLKKFSGVAVANAQFWLDKPIMTSPKLHFGTAGSTPVFADMNLSCEGYQTKNGGSLIETVITFNNGGWEMSNDEILDRAWKELQSYFPKEAANAKVLKSSLVKIPQSVYAPFPNLEEYRPSQQTPIPNLFLAGGFTKGHEFFDSMEGAVQSGYLAVEKLVQNCK